MLDFFSRNNKIYSFFENRFILLDCYSWLICISFKNLCILSRLVEGEYLLFSVVKAQSSVVEKNDLTMSFIETLLKNFSFFARKTLQYF